MKLSAKGLENFARLNAALRGSDTDTPGEDFVGDLYAEVDFCVEGGYNPRNHIGYCIRGPIDVTSIA